MKAVVMAGGSGSRLRPLTVGRPKPMVPLVNRPVLAHILDLLKLHGFAEVIITVQYLADHIEDYFCDGSSLGLTLRYSVEETPLGTAGSVKNAQHYLDDTFLVISGDAVTDIDLSEALRFHQEHKALATLTLKSVADPLEYGIVVTNGEGRITQFVEKPGWGQVISDTVNTGIYVLEPQVLDRLKPDTLRLFPRRISRSAGQGRSALWLRGQRLLVRYREYPGLHVIYCGYAGRQGASQGARGFPWQRTAGQGTERKSARWQVSEVADRAEVSADS